MKDDKKNHQNDRSNKTERDKKAEHKEEHGKHAAQPSTESPNPPRTTTGKLTAPMFGSAGGGGAELEPGPEKI